MTEIESDNMYNDIIDAREEADRLKREFTNIFTVDTSESVIIDAFRDWKNKEKAVISLVASYKKVVKK